MISMDKKYKTKHGKSVRLLCTDGPDLNYPVVGFEEGDTEPRSWTVGGIYSIRDDDDYLDLVEVVPPKLKPDSWYRCQTINIYVYIDGTLKGGLWSGVVFNTNTGELFPTDDYTDYGDSITLNNKYTIVQEIENPFTTIRDI